MSEEIYERANEINIIADAIDQSSAKNIIISAAKQTLHFNVDNGDWVYYLKSGEVNVCRLSDNIVVRTASAPAIVGLTSLFNVRFYHYLSTNVDSVIVRIKIEDAYDIIDKKNLWKEACWIVSSAAQFYYVRDEMVYGNNVYGVIKNHLEIIWSMPEEQRRETSIFNFILCRTGISRSSLNKVLKDLFKGGYISMKRGKLVDMKKLPLRY